MPHHHKEIYQNIFNNDDNILRQSRLAYNAATRYACMDNASLPANSNQKLSHACAPKDPATMREQISLRYCWTVTLYKRAAIYYNDAPLLMLFEKILCNAASTCNLYLLLIGRRSTTRKSQYKNTDAHWSTCKQQ